MLMPSHPGLQRWLLPILLAILVPLLFAALPGEPLQTLARDAGLVKHVRNEMAALHAVRDGFRQVLEAEPVALSGHSAQVQTLTVSGVGQALDRIAAEAGPASEHGATLRDAVEAYAWTLTRGAAVDRYGGPTRQLASAPSHAIEAALGRLQAGDEARLREPLVAMHQAEAAMRFQRDPRLADQVSHGAAIFAARLDAMAIPPGTRTHLLARLAAYEHAVLKPDDALPRLQVDLEGTQAAVRSVEAALAAADRALTAEQLRLDNAFEAACKGFLWSFAAALGAALSIVGAGIFGGIGLDYRVARSWHAR
jgi:hypothetical protein